MTAIAARTPARLPLPSYFLGGQLVFAVMVWGGTVAAYLLFLFAFGLFRDLEVSIWNFVSQAARWYGLVIGSYFGYSYLPLAIAHGMTRRRFMAGALVFIAAFAPLGAALMTITYPIEALVYSWAGWQQVLLGLGPVDLPGQLPAFFLDNLLHITLWTCGGLMMGAAFYRNTLLGFVAILWGLVLAAMSDAIRALGLAAIAGPTINTDGPFRWLDLRLPLSDAGLVAAAVLAYAITAGLALLTAWFLIREMPVRSSPG